MEDNKKRKLYDNLTSDGYKLGTYEEFDSNMQKDDISRRFYDNMTSDGYKLGSYDDFKGIVKNAEEQQEPVDYSAGQTTNFKVSEDMLGSSDGAVKDTVPIVQLTDGSYMSEDAYNKAQNRHKELTEKYGEGYVEFKDGSAMSRKDYDKMMETDAALTRQYGAGYVTLQGGQHMSRKDYDAKMAEYNKAKAEYYDKYDKLSAEERKAIDIYSMLEKNGKNDNNVNDIPDAFKSMCDKTAGKKGSDDSYVKAWWALSPEERKKWVDAAINDVMAKRTPKIPFKAGEEEMPSIVDLLEENRVRMENLTRAEMDEYGNRYIDAVDSSKHSPEMIQRSYIDRMGGMYGTAEEAMQFNKNLDDLEERQRQSAEMFKNTLPTQLDNAISDVERTIDARWNDNVSLTAEPGADYWLTRASGNGAILTAYDMLRDAKEIVEAANKQGWASNAVGGFTDAVSSMKVWSMGVQDLFNTAELMAISKKMKSGEELTDDEKTLLNAVSMLKAVNDVFDDKISMWYKAGKVTGEMLPYMLQMAMNPTASGAKAVGKAITDKLSTGLVRTIEKETGRVSVKAVSDLTAQQMLKAGVRNIGARVVGEIAQNSLSSAGLAASLQAAQVAADAAQRYNGEARFVYDADGNVQFGGFTDGDTALKAIAKAYGAMTVENFSEGVGEWLKPIFSAGGGALAKALTKANMGFLPNFVNAMNNTQFAKAMDKFFKVTKYDGPISEFIEEKISPLMDYALGIDRDSVMEGYLDKKENMELLLSVSILGVVSGTVNMMHYPFALKKAKADLENATKKAQMLYSEGEWAALKATIDEMPADYFSEFMDKHQVQPEDDATERAKKRALLEYVVRTSNYRAVNAIDAFDKASGKTDWVVEQMTKAEQEGYEAQGVKKQQLSAEMDAAEELLGYYLPEGTSAEEFASKYGTTAEEQMRNIDEDESLTDVTKSALKQYITSSVKYNAMVTAAQEDIDAAVRRARAEVKKTDNNGERVRVTTTDEREGYVVQGNTQTDTAVQVLYDGEETPTMVGSKSVMSETRTSTEEDATAAENAAREAATSEVAASIDIPEPVNGFQQQFQPEDRVLVNVGGQQVSGTVIRMNNDNVNMPAYQVQLDAPVNGNNVAVVPADQTFSEEDAQRIEAMREQARQNMKAATEVAQPVSTTQEGQVQGGGVEQPVAATQQQYEMLKNEDGSTNYVGSGVDATLQQMESLDEEDKAPFVNANKNAAQERFNKAQEAVAEVERTKPAIGTDIEAYNTAKQAWQQQRDAAMNELNDAKKALDFWNEVEGRMNSNDAVNVPAEEDLDELAKFLGVKPELLKAIKALCDSIGVNVEFANYLTTEDGKSMTNGEFDPRTNTIRLSKLQILNGTAIEFIFGHEMTHGLKQKSPELYQKYVDAVRKAMGLAFMRNFNRMLPQYISIATDIASQRGMNGKAVMDAFKNAVKTGEPIDWTAEGKDEATKAAFQYVFDYVTEEVVSDNAGNMLSDSTFQKEMGISMDKSMLDTVLDTVSSLINLVKKISGDYRAYEEKVSEIESAFKDAAKAWKEMADNAGEAGEATAKDIKKEMDGAGLVMEGGAVMNNEAQELKHEEGYQTPNEMTDTDMALKYSYATKDDWMLDYLKGKPSKRMKVIADMVNNWYEMAAADDAVHDYMSYGQYPGGDLNKDGKGPLRSNVEYVYTFDLDTTCPRTFQYLMYADRIEKRIHRPLSQREAVILIETMRAYGQEIPCVYCYAENKRQALKNYYMNFISARNGVLNAKNEQEAFAAMYGKNNKGELTDAAEKVYEKWRGDNALNGYRPSMQMLFDHYNQARDIVLTWLDDAMEAGKITTKLSDSKLTGMLCEEFGIPTGRSVAQEYKGMKTSISNIVNEWRYDVIESTGRDVPKDKMHKNHKEMSGMMGFNLNALALWDEMVKYGKSASSAKNAVRYFPYTSQLKDVPNKKKDYINAMGGLRMHSTNDFRIDYVGDYIQLIADMDKYGWKGHTYTKSPLFVKIFGNTGYRINMSIAAYDINGEVKENHDEGHFWDEAKALREKFPNAGTMFMTTSSAQLQYALDADWVDMIIPFHASGLPKEIWYNMRRWEDATNSQNEEFYNAEDKKRRLREAGVQFKRSISAEALNELYDATFETIKVYDNTKAMKEELKGAGQSIKSGITYEELAMQYKDFFGHKCKTKGERIKPHFLPGETYKGGNVIPGHGNDVKKYFELCEQYGVRPRFQGIEVMVDGEMTDVTNHPGYIKLIKETARTDSEQTEVEFNLDEPNEALGINPDTGSAYTPLEYAMYELRDHAKRGGYQYESSEQFGIVEEFMTNVIQHERETGEERPLDYISDDARAMWFVQNDAANFAAMDANEQLGDIPYHPAKKYSVVDTDSENFKRWFVDSKVVNKYGDPLVMSHNTDKDFWTFDKERIGTGQGQAFLGQGFNFSRGGSSVYGKNEMKVYLSIKNPMTSNKVTITRTQLRNIINELNSKSTERIEDSWGTMNDCITALMEYAEGDMDLYATIGMTYYGDAKDVISVFEKHGFDGTIEYNADGEIRNAVAFEPTQIKSATDNNGNFDPENADIRYSVVPGEKTLYGSHNISEENLRKVIKKGGFANPSVAVSDIEKGTHEGFGEITLLLPSEKIDSRTGDNGGTWTDDTWTPVYPKTRRMFTEEGGKKFAGMLDEIGVDEGIRKELMNEERQMVYGSEPDFHWLYLKSKNIDTTEYNHPDLISYWKEIFRQYNSAGKLIDALRNGNNEPLAENVKRAIESYLVVKLQNEHPELYTEGDINDIDSIITANRSNKKKIREVYGSEDGKYGDDIIKEAFNNKLKAYKSKKHGVDAKGTMQNAYYVTTEKGLENDYKRWLDDMLDTFGSKDEIINGADRNGNAKYMPNTLQNASNVMNSGKQKGNNTLGGWGAFIAEFAKNMGTLDEIRDNKGKIIGSKEERADVTKKFIELATLLHSKNSELGLWDGTASKTLAKIVKSSNIESACNKYGIELNEQEMTDLKEFAKKMKSGVALFFETKFNRPVMMSEFVSAVVPKKTSADIIDALEKSGLSVYKYDPNKEGNRSEVIKKAASRKGVKFSVAADESLLDKAERIYAENKDTVIEPEYGDAPVKYSVVTDPDELERLNNDPEGYVEMYCSMAKIGGNYYSPMASKEPQEVTFKNGKKGIRNVLANPMQIGDWDKAARKTLDDPLVRIDPEDPTGERWQYRLIKPNGKDMWVAYNPYEHSTASPLNDQFTSAYDRPELVIVKVRIPKSDLNSKEKAPGAKDAVGTIKWHEGPVASLLDGTKDQRYVSLSNYRQIIEEVPVEKEAKEIAEILNKYGIAMPINVVRPQLREELVKLGVKFGPIKGQVRDADVPKLNKILADINGTDGPEGGKKYSIAEAKEEAEKYGYGAPYQGSKNLQVNDLMDVLPGGKRFVDLFSGGGAMTHGALLSGKYGNVLMNDIDGAGQQLFLDGIDGKYEGYDKTYDKETFKDIAHTPEAYIWSHRNNGRSFQGDRAESRVARVNALQALKPVRDMITTSNEDYRNVAIKDGDVLYADIPYADTDTQAYNRFDVKEFTEWAKGLDVPVYVSSKADSKLDGFTKILEKEYTSGGKKRAEGLFVQDKFADNGYGKKYSVSKEGKYIPDLKNYDNVLQEIKEKNVSLQKIPVRSFKASDGLWREGLNDYIVRLKSILNGKNKITYTESVVRNNRSDNSSVRYYSDFIQQKSKREVQGTNKTNIILPYDRGLIKDAISRAESEIKRRGYIEERLREKYDIGEDGSISLDNLRALFESVNSDKKNEALFDAVSHAIKNKNEGIYIADPSHGRAAGSFDVITGNVNYRMDNIVRNMSNGKAASVILHELIHRATKDLILQSRIPLYREVMRRDVFYAANNIRQIYDAVSKAFPEDKIGKRAYYGANSVDEMVAELANPEFREALRNIKWDKKEKRTLLDKLLGLIKKMLIGCIPNNKVSGNALADAEDALSTLLNNFSDANYDLSRSLYKTIGKFIDSINSEEKTGRQPGESLIDYAARIDAARKEGEKKYSVAVEESDPFYSNAARAVDGIKQEKATGEQWLAMLRKNGGLKAEEDKWMGLSDWLGGKKSVTKDEVLQYIAENSVKVEEVEYSENTLGRYDEHWDYFDNWIRENVKDNAEAWINSMNNGLAYTDGKGFYFTINHSKPEQELLARINDSLDKSNPINGTRLGYTTNGLTNKREIALTVPTIEPYNASDMIHFGDAGEGRAVAWLRFGDALTNDGQRVLVIDEVQSKRHQDGRENGYRSEDFIPYSEAKKLFYDYKDSIKEKYGISKERTVQLSDWMTYEENKEYVRLLDQMTSRMNDRSVPDAPFQKTWHELAMKRALRYAAENGYDAVAWTTGRQQSDRYNLANGPVYVDSIVVSHEDYDYQNNEWGDYNNAKETQPKFVRIRLSNEGDVDFNVSKDGTILDGEFKGRRLSEVVGSNIATKILSTPVEEYETTYQGDDFVFDEETGGKGMAGFYDKMLPSFMDKYGKKWGVKTHDIELDLPNERDRVMHAVDVTPEMRESVMKGQPMYSIAMDEYNGKVNHKEWMKENYMARLRESWQDGMISLKVLADAVLKETGGDMKDYENFYNAFNQLSSRNTADMERFNKKFMEPLIDEISKIINGASGMRGKMNAYTANNGQALKELTDYMIAKHGLERNEVFYDRDLNRWQEAHDKWEAGGMVGTEPQVPDKHDYSGLTALTGETDYTAMTAAAQYIVDEYEKVHDTTELWNRVNAATKDTLKKQYESGMISKANYEKVRDMFQWYIPLRGFDEKTAEDAYQYYNSSNSFSPTLKAATGRESLADNPFVFISNMADSAIMQGNKNVAKQHLLDFAMNHPSDVMSVSEMWYEKDASGEWVPVTANIPSDATPEEVKKAVDQFEEWMQQRKDNGEDVSKTKAGLNSKYIIESKADSKQHQITLKRLGKDYIIYINGDPRAAQAINGLIGSNKDGYGVIRRINRWLSAAYTSQNPSFVLSNLVRDSIFGLTMIGVKESPAYAYNYMKNYVEVVPAMPVLMYKHSKDSKVRTDIRKYYEEFVANGGQTGFAYLKGRDEVKKDIMKELGHPDWNNTRKIGQTIIMNGNGIVPIVKAVSKAADLASEWAENIVRFATYMTSREMGRGIERSISDAKEITLNFNRTGSGEGVAGLAKSIYLFLNPAIQAIHKVCEAAVDHPIKMSVAAAFYAALGYVLPKLMLGDGDDDKDTYFGVPDFSRRNNVVIPLGKEDYLMIPLPPEMRALYSVGEILYSLEQGHQSGDEAEQIASQMMSFVPLDFTSNGGDIVTNLLPDAFKPVEQVMKNKKFYGAPIYKEGYGSADKEKPGYTKAFRGTSSQLVEATKWLNEQGGGDEYTSGGYWYDWNPAILEHLVQGYTGGKGKTLVQLASLPKAIMEGVKNPKEVPVIDRFWGKIDDPDERKAIERDFRNWTKDIEAISMRMKGYDKKMEKGDTIGYAERRNYMANSGEVELKAAYDYYNKNDDNRKYRGIHSLKQDIKKYEEAGNMVYADSARQEMYNEMQQCIDLLNQLDIKRKEYMKHNRMPKLGEEK